jgi:hypothetical protein
LAVVCHYINAGEWCSTWTALRIPPKDAHFTDLPSEHVPQLGPAKTMGIKHPRLFILCLLSGQIPHNTSVWRKRSDRPLIPRKRNILNAHSCLSMVWSWN